MKVLLTGATGFVGQHLAQALLAKGHELNIISRSTKRAKKIFSDNVRIFEWKSDKQPLPSEAIANTDTVIHLAGASLTDKRWTEEFKTQLYDSRVRSSEQIVAAINVLQNKPKLFISASAIGFYGNRGEEHLSEESSPGDDFLSNLCKDWESAKEQIKDPSTTRCVNLRLGVVLGKNGGLYQMLAPLVKLHIAGPLSDGEQWMSWIHIDDLIQSVLFTMENEEIKGAINVVSPKPVRNREFMQSFAKGLNSGMGLSMPKFLLKAVKGEVGEHITASQKVYPKVLQSKGFQFQKTDLVNIFAEFSQKAND